MTARTSDRWCRALLDCGGMRVAFDDDVLIKGIDLGLVDYRAVDDDENALDVWLSDEGKKVALKRLCRRLRRNMAEVMADEQRQRETDRGRYERERRSVRT